MDPIPSLKRILRAQFKHRELVFWSVGLLLFIILFVQFLMRPVHRDARNLEKEIVAFEERYQRVVGKGGDLEEILLAREKELVALDIDLPRQEKLSAILTALSSKASKLEIRVISVLPTPAVPYPNPENPLHLEGKICEALSIQMNLQCSYRILGSYLESLSEEFPSALTIDRVEIRKRIGKTSALNVTLHVTAYLFVAPAPLSERKAPWQ